MNNLNTPVIVAAKRTPIGTFNGSIASLAANELGATCIRAILAETKLDPTLVEDVILGQILTAGEGQNPARQAALKANIPFTTPAISINKLCGSGMKAIHYAAQAIQLGDADIVLAGGQENMSISPHLLPHSREGRRMGDWSLADSMILDALTCAMNGYHMGVTAENVAKAYQIERHEQDAYAVASQNKAEQAQKAGKFEAEICPVSVPQRKSDPLVFAQDEYIRTGVTLDKISGLRPAFAKTDGTVTAGNASGINDGAAVVMVTSLAKAQELGLTPLARIVAYSSAGVDPSIMGTGPIPATQKCLKRAGWTIDDLDLIESNEAFAAQALAVNKALGWDTDKVNVNGGAIALGHPVGASGARIITTLLYAMRERGASKGLATMCIGGGQGIATALELC